MAYFIQIENIFREPNKPLATGGNCLKRTTVVKIQTSAETTILLIERYKNSINDQWIFDKHKNHHDGKCQQICILFILKCSDDIVVDQTHNAGARLFGSSISNFDELENCMKNSVWLERFAQIWWKSLHFCIFLELPVNARLGRFENVGYAHNEPEIPETRANDQGADSKSQAVERFKLAKEGLLQTYTKI